MKKLPEKFELHTVGAALAGPLNALHDCVEELQGWVPAIRALRDILGAEFYPLYLAALHNARGMDAAGGMDLADPEGAIPSESRGSWACIEPHNKEATPPYTLAVTRGGRSFLPEAPSFGDEGLCPTQGCPGRWVYVHKEEP